MRTCNLEPILRNAQFLVTGKRELPSDQDFPGFLGHVDLAVADGWRAEWWPALMHIEKRFFRPFLTPSVGGDLTADSTEITADTGPDITADLTTFGSGEDITAGDEIYWGPTQTYYIALKNFTMNSPDTDPADSDGDLNTAYWALLESSYAGDDYDDTETYAVGDIVYYSHTDRSYALHTAAAAGTLPTDTGSWGVLNEFDRYVDFDAEDQTPIGDVFDCKTGNPRRSTDFESLDWTTLDDKVWIRTADKFMWIEFRTRRPEITGAVYDVESTYSEGDQVYWDNDETIPGNLYRALDDVEAGVTPTDHIESEMKWEVVEIPKFLEGYLTWSAAARFLAGEREEPRRALFAATAEGYLALETDNIYRQQTQVPHIAPRTY